MLHELISGWSPARRRPPPGERGSRRPQPVPAPQASTETAKVIHLFPLY